MTQSPCLQFTYPWPQASHFLGMGLLHNTKLDLMNCKVLFLSIPSLTPNANVPQNTQEADLWVKSRARGPWVTRLRENGELNSFCQCGLSCCSWVTVYAKHSTGRERAAHLSDSREQRTWKMEQVPDSSARRCTFTRLQGTGRWVNEDQQMNAVWRTPRWPRRLHEPFKSNLWASSADFLFRKQKLERTL